ncbi:MAG: GatB/YqeY domain-containing protein [Candidatus Wolfebacteria bacterium]|nr:GatB/YqeY domain-containing protein [Candidatus Wolfebacteria bacterium]
MFTEKITQEIIIAMKAGDSFRTGTLRMVSAALHNKEIEKKSKGKEPELTDEEAIEVLTKEAKKRKEAIDIYAKAGRQELADKEKKELEIISTYLPEQMGEAEIEKVIDQVLSRMGANPDGKSAAVNGAGFGQIMGAVMKELKGKADASLVSAILKKKSE